MNEGPAVDNYVQEQLWQCGVCGIGRHTTAMRMRDEMHPDSRRGNAQSDLGKTAVLVAVVATLFIGGVLAFALNKAPFFRFHPNEKLYGKPE